MLSKIVSVGDRIELRKIELSKRKSLDENNSKLFISKVYDILTEDRLTIAMPIIEGKLIPLEKGDEYNVYFITQKGLYQCRTIIVERYKLEALYVLVVDIISNLEKYQRRQYYRLDCLIDFKYRILSEDEIKLIKENHDFTTSEGIFTNATALDISGGGMRFLSPGKLELNDKIIIKLNIDYSNEKLQFEIPANVVHINDIKNNNELQETRIQFFNIKNNIREILIKYIFEQDRMQRKRVRD